MLHRKIMWQNQHSAIWCSPALQTVYSKQAENLSVGKTKSYWTNNSTCHAHTSACPAGEQGRLTHRCTRPRAHCPHALCQPAPRPPPGPPASASAVRPHVSPRRRQPERSGGPGLDTGALRHDIASLARREPGKQRDRSRPSSSALGSGPTPAGKDAQGGTPAPPRSQELAGWRSHRDRQERQRAAEPP